MSPVPDHDIDAAAPARVTIPDDLAAEIRRDLASTSPRIRARWLFQGVPRGCRYVTGLVDDVEVFLTVGSADGGPRPDIGDRILPLRPAGPVGVVRDVDRYGAWIAFQLPSGVEHRAPVDRWAILPALPEPAAPDDGWRTPEQHRAVHEAAMAELAPGALPAHQLYTPPSAAEQDAMRAGMRAARAAERRADAVDAIVCWLADVDDPLDAPERLRDLTGLLVDAMNASLAATGRLPFLSATDRDADRVERDRCRAALQRIADEDTSITKRLGDIAREALDGAP